MAQTRIHLIAVGGAAMHNIALDLHAAGYVVTGSDDEIYNPSLSRLTDAGICPEKTGWFPEKITSQLDAVILGMHARADNPELLRALELKIPVFSYPAFIYEHCKHKKRVVIAGSHGKTTTTSMILHVLKKLGVDFDYLVGAQLPGFERMVRLSKAPIVILEGDEYLSSPIDRVPKIHHYRPHIAVLTGVAWDHINVFPTFEMYRAQFEKFIDLIEPGGLLIYDEDDAELQSLTQAGRSLIQIGYSELTSPGRDQVSFKDRIWPVAVFGGHNLRNMHAAYHVCHALEVSDEDFFGAMSGFTGAARRLQKLDVSSGRTVYLDFAHAPSKVKATTRSFGDWLGTDQFLAVLELHTFSSLNESFLPEYCNSLQAASQAVVYVDQKTLEIKQMPMPDPEFVRNCFQHQNCIVITEKEALLQYLQAEVSHLKHILLMSSGKFGGLDTSTL
jgi:UDP-N-acetylmuramate: L-alanyl-gamma-D-glutamyl-meso-diaminopimelate ligase